MRKNTKKPKPPEYTLPFKESEIPSSRENAGKRIFTKDFVVMNGHDYFMRVFYDGSSEFVRFDTAAKKWAVLIFPAA
jgi:hypothetical protein